MNEERAQRQERRRKVQQESFKDDSTLIEFDETFPQTSCTDIGIQTDYQQDLASEKPGTVLFCWQNSVPTACQNEASSQTHIVLANPSLQPLNLFYV